MTRLRASRKITGFMLSAAIVLSTAVTDLHVYAEEAQDAGNAQEDVLYDAAGYSDPDMEDVPDASGFEAEALYDDTYVEDGYADGFDDTESVILENEEDETWQEEDDALENTAYTDTLDSEPDEDVADDPFAGLIEDMDESGPDEQVETEEEIEIDVADPFAPDSYENVPDMDGGFLLAASSKAGTSSFDGTYGQQLSGMAKKFYDAMVSHYMNNRGTGDWEISCMTQNGSGYVFHVDDLSNYTSSDLWKSARAQMAHDVQSCINAFGYDYPQMFWERIYSTSWVKSSKADSEGSGGTVTIKTLRLKTKPTYTGSTNDIVAFFDAVDNTALQLSETCDYSGDGLVSDTEYAKGAHDYAATALWYDNETLQQYRSNPDHAEAYRVFTPAPAFIPALNGGGVCEAYSRTVKVLLDAAGVPCCLISGDTHMWNGIMIDGAWYLTDATWDDNGTDEPGTKYLLSGSDSKHTASGRLTGTQTELVFSVPSVSSDRAAHTFGEWNITQNATCIANGEKERTCCICGYEETETITDGDHQFTGWSVVDQPSCTKQGKRTRACTLCTETETETIPAEGHMFSGWTTLKKATCTENGIETRKCDKCGETEERSVPATGHSFGQWTVTKEATCTARGAETRKCSACGETQSRDIEAKGHSYKKEVIAPTCTMGGYTLYTCEKCRDSYRENPVNALGHSFAKDNAKSTPATCVSDGRNVFVCSGCGKEKSDPVTKTGHRWSSWKKVSSATVWSPDIEQRECSVCGAKETRKTGMALAPKISLNAYSITLRKNQKTTKIKVSGLAKGDAVKAWTSSDTGIVTCGKGWIRAGKKTGTAYVTITTKAGASARIAVKVQKKKVAVSKISVASKNVSLKKGETFRLNTISSPLTAEYPIKYKSSKKKTATVSKSGVIKAKKAGKCVITVKCGKKKVKVKVTVRG